MKNLAKWNDKMVLKYHKDGTLFESKNPLLRFVEKLRLKKIIKAAQLKKEDVLLDLGCGEGFLISLLPDLKKTVGIDISKVALKKAKKILKNKNAQLQWGDAQKLDLPDEYFDKIICSEVLEHVPDPKIIMKEINRLIKKDGIVVISVPDEQKIKSMMKMIKKLGLNKILHAARKQEDYEWHLHQADKNFILDISKSLFKVKKIYRTPPILGYRFVAVLKKQ